MWLLDKLFKKKVKKDISVTVLKVVDEFSDAKEARFFHNSGLRFLEDVLEPKFLETMKEDNLLLIDFDEAYGYPSSFLAQTFGNLSHKYGAKTVLKYLRFMCRDEPGLVEEVEEYIYEQKKFYE